MIFFNKMYNMTQDFFFLFLKNNYFLQVQIDDNEIYK